MEQIQPVILCGGSGTRLWPMSRCHFPKQFLTLTDASQSLLQKTLERTHFLQAQATLVCNETHRFIVSEQCRSIGYKPQSIILEPGSRNTAPAVALAALAAQDKGEDPLLLVMPSDHCMENPSAFEAAVQQAALLAADNYLVTFGVQPIAPETGYGYICAGQPLAHGGLAIEHFVEKPDVELAEQYVRSGCYLWNSGVFLFRASTFLAELGEHRPKILDCCRQVIDQQRLLSGAMSLPADVFNQCPSESIDTAVMEQTRKAAVCPLDAGWSDVGSWDSLWDISDKDDQGNSLQGDVITRSSSNCLVRSNSRLVSLVGVENLVVVETVDAILVADKSRMQEVKDVAAELKSCQRYEHELHREVYRPWGKYDSIDRGKRFQVKHITVKPGESLSLQMHHHRAEHWIVVSGTAEVVRGEGEMLLSENESVYIPIGVTHRLSNPGKVNLELIEVQSGAYLGEDDIVRFSDCYQRA